MLYYPFHFSDSNAESIHDESYCSQNYSGIVPRTVQCKNRGEIFQVERSRYNERKAIAGVFEYNDNCEIKFKKSGAQCLASNILLQKVQISSYSSTV